MDIYGMALTSPGLCSPGLLGTQGWSPSSSVYSDDCEEDYMTVNKQPKRRSVDFPMPPKRLQTTRPLSLMKPRAVSAKIVPPSKAMEAWLCSGEEEMISGLDALGIMAPSKKMRNNKPKNLQLPVYSRRVFSAPAPPPAYTEIHIVDDSPEQEPDEYPFPIMPAPRHDYYHINTTLEDEKEKMRRLQASMTLLNVGVSDHDEEDMSPLHKLSFKPNFLSPEHRAPSLAEQMAYACGLGNQLSWSSPNKLVRASSDIYLPITNQDISTNAQEERKMASRHIRQVVAANGSAPMTRNVSIQSAFIGEEAEVGSSWSHKAFGDHDMEGEDEVADESDNDDQYWLQSSVPMGQSFSQHSMAASTIVSVNSSPILHGALSGVDFAGLHSGQSSKGSDIDSPSTCATSVQSHATSNGGKANGWGEVDVECLFAQGLALQEEEEEEVISGCSSSNSSEAAVTPSDTPNSLHEFSYIIDNEQFNLVTFPSPKALVNAFGDDGFNGNTFSPALTTPELDAFPGTPIGFAASPVMDQSSLEPHPSVKERYADLRKQSIDSNFTRSEYFLPSSTSTVSVLERPRPFSRSVTSSFFGGVDVNLAHREQMMASNTSTSIKQLSEKRRPSAMPSIANNSQPEIPIRKSSLDLASSVVSSGHNSVQAFYEENNKLLSKRSRKPVPSVSFADLPITRPKSTSSSSPPSRPYTLPTSQSEMTLSSAASSGRLSSKALCQVREACRAKEDYVRNNALNKAEVEEEVAEAKRQQRLMAQGPPHPTMIRSGKSAPGNLNAASSQQKKISPKEKSRKITSSLHQRSPAEYQGLPRPSSSLSFTVSDSAKVPLPTLFVARSNSQRKKGITGIPATEPALLALAKLGFRTEVATRRSKAEALIHKPDALQEGGMLKNMPNGVVLIVEEKYVQESHVIVS